jgi:hypothetical protein
MITRLNLSSSLILIALSIAGSLVAQDNEGDEPFVAYPEPITTYLKRTQQGDQKHAFDPTKDFAAWQEQARRASCAGRSWLHRDPDIASTKEGLAGEAMALQLSVRIRTLVSRERTLPL